MAKFVKLNTQEGLTLAEILVAVFVLSVGIVSLLLFYTNTNTSLLYARDITIATTHGEYIFEEMQRRDSLANVTSTNWENWAQGEGLNTLPQESINIYIANTEADPLDITATISWIRRLRENSIVLITQMTKW